MAINNAKVLADIKKWQKDIEEAIELKVQEVAVEIVESLVQYSVIAQPLLWKIPDTTHVPGKYVSNWHLGVNEVPSYEINTQGDTGANSIQAAKTDGLRYKIGDSIAIVNTTDYAVILEKDPSYTLDEDFIAQNGVLQPTINDISSKSNWIIPTS